MTTEIKRRRGTTAQHTAFTGAIGEFTYDTDQKKLVAHDGATAGGFPAARDDQVVRHDTAQGLTAAQQAQLQANLGAFGNGILSKAANYTVVVGDNGKLILADAAAGAVTIALPAAATAGAGFKLTAKKTNMISSTQTVTLDGDSAETIDGETTYVLYLKNQSVTIVCDGSNWHVVNETGTVLRGGNANGDYELHADGRLKCWHNDGLAQSNVNLLTYSWTYSYAFAASPLVTHTPDFSTSTNFGTDKRENSFAQVQTVSPNSASVQLVSNARYLGGDEAVNSNMCAIGDWR